MQKGFLYTTLLNQEQRATKLFLVLYYLLQVVFDFFYYYVFPRFGTGSIGINQGGLGYGLYIIQLALLPVALYLLAKNKPVPIKYIYLTVYIVATMTNDLMMYIGRGSEFASGSIADIFTLVFSPIFLNKRFFWLVAGGITAKYVVIGLVLQTGRVIIPIGLVVVLSSVAYILLIRFVDYVNAIRDTYHTQLEQIVKGIVATLELKDPYTRGHSERVAHFSLILAHKMNKFTEDELKSFYYACLLHDVGKVNIPDYILTKPSSLTEKEYEIIKVHPVVGANAMRGIEGLKGSVDVILYHHERWDGKGYPDELRGEQIPLMARIASVADAFDAMTSKRSYRDALSVDEAYKRILQGKGTQFDPQVVEAFQEIYPLWANYIRQSEASSSLFQPKAVDIQA